MTTTRPWRGRDFPARARRCDRVGLVVAAAITIVLAIVVLRVAQLQVAPGDRLAAYIHEGVTRRVVPAIRGDITDRRGRLLATTRLGYRVFVDPVELDPQWTARVEELARAIGTDPAALAQRIDERVAENQRREALAAAAGATERPPPEGIRARLAFDLAALAGVELMGPPGATARRDHPLPIRYARISDVVGDEVAERVRALRIPGVHLERWPEREYPGGEPAAAIVGKVGVNHDGLLGVEYIHDGELRGERGQMLYVRDARGRPLWIGEGDYTAASPGRPLRLSIDLEVQRLALAALEAGVTAADAAGGRVVVLDARTGEVLAMADVVRTPRDAVPFPWPKIGSPPSADAIPRARYVILEPDPARDIHPSLARNRCVEDVYEPGSTFKPIAWSLTTELGRAKPEEVFNTENGRWYKGRRLIEDVAPAPSRTWRDVLIASSNIGMAKGVERLTGRELRDGVVRFGFGARTGVGLPGEATGLVTAMRDWRPTTQTSVSFGYEVAVTPMQMARAYTVFAGPAGSAGYLAPVRLDAVRPDEPAIRHRVLPSWVAEEARDALREVAAKVDGRMPDKGIDGHGWRYSWFGKSGTSRIALGAPPEGHRRPRGMRGYYEKQYISSFVAGAPAEDARLIVVVTIDDPGPRLVAENRYYGSNVAGPVARRILEHALSYLAVPPSPGALTARAP